MLSLRPITTIKLFDEQAFLAAGTANSTIIDLRHIAQGGFFSVEYTVGGSGTFKLEYLICSTRAGTFIEPAAASDIGATLSSHGFKSFSPLLAPFMKIKATEDGGAQPATLTLLINVQ